MLEEKKDQATFLHTMMWRSKTYGGLSLTIGSPKMPLVSSPLGISLHSCQIVQTHLLRSSSFMHVLGETHYYWLPQPFRLSLQGDLFGKLTNLSNREGWGKSWVWKGYSCLDFLPTKGKTRLYLIPFQLDQSSCRGICWVSEQVFHKRLFQDFMLF